MSDKILIKIGKEGYNVTSGQTLLRALFEAFPTIDKKGFCQRAKCKNCYCLILRKGSTEPMEVLACQTVVRPDIRILGMSKKLQKKEGDES
ncbi:2Fe-2S iron-sulfur cluster binding domain-containing protein [bacterium]|nr:2Fe-2S iron-sulfur cluster binding domain-containing protein [bacterium]